MPERGWRRWQCLGEGVHDLAEHVAGIRTENLAELVDAGDELEVVAADFGLSKSDLRAALAYEWRRSRATAA